jgi:coenzyme F420 hydrogenase subunit beta
MNPIEGLNELNRDVIARGLCAGCGACVGRCPYLLKFKGKTIKLDNCVITEGRCHAYCPMTFFDAEAASRFVFDAPYDEGGIGNWLEVFAARASSRDWVKVAQAGATVSTLVIAALEEGVMDAAVLTRGDGENGYPKGVVVTTPEEALACAGSKFAASHSLDALKEALDMGYGRIGVVGVPCQVKALRKMALYDLKAENLKERIGPVIGLFCNWALSLRDFTPFLKSKVGDHKIVRVNSPPPPENVLEWITEEGLDDVSLDEIRPMIQPACAACDDMTSEFADVSVGMFEGRPGWNTMIVRTEDGRKLVEEAKKTERLRVESFPSENLEHLREASRAKKRRASTAEANSGKM